MRLLLDENLPADLARALVGHHASTVTGLGGQGIKNGELLRRACGRFEALLTMDRKLPNEHPLTDLPFGVLLICAPSNRLAHLLPLVPDVLDALSGLRSGELRVVGV